jgi:hypothetical protein
MLFLEGKIPLDIKEELTGPKACLAPGSRLLLELMCWLLAKLTAAVVAPGSRLLLELMCWLLAKLKAAVVVVAGVADDADWCACKFRD